MMNGTLRHRRRRHTVNNAIRRVKVMQAASPPDGGFIESFNTRLRGELLNGGIFYTLQEVHNIV
jgi:hypothetical protein